MKKLSFFVFIAFCLAVIGCVEPGAAIVAPGAATADFDANAAVTVTAMLASPEINARLADIIQFSPEVQAAFKAMYHQEASQTSGPQTAGEGGVNIGTVLLNGSSGIILAALAGAGLAGFLLWKLRKSKTLIDMLVKYNETNGGVDTEKLRGMALSRKVEPLLRSRIAKVRKNGSKL